MKQQTMIVDLILSYFNALFNTRFNARFYSRSLRSLTQYLSITSAIMVSTMHIIRQVIPYESKGTK